MSSKDWNSRLLWATIAVVGAGTLCACVVALLLGGYDGDLVAGVAFGCLACIAAALTAVLCRRHGANRIVAGLGVALPILLAVLLLLMVASDWRNLWRRFGEYWVYGGGCCLLLAYLCLLDLTRVPPRWRWTRVLTRMSAVVLTGIWSFNEIVHGYTPEIERTLLLLLLFTTGGTTVVLALHLVRTRRGYQRLVTTQARIRVTCPRCEAEQELPPGRSTCRTCGLAVRIEIEEEQCPKCGYVLYRLTSARCPECGTKVLDKWKSPSA